MKDSNHYVYILMGVSGSGKSAVASILAHKLNAAMVDGDYLHPRTNVNKMSAGCALTDEDRAPWLAALNDAIFAMQRTNEISILVCSALKKHYRDRLREGNSNVKFIYLKGSMEVIADRLKQRKGHFFKPQMLESQFDALEEPDELENDVQVINIDQPLSSVVADTINYIVNTAAAATVAV